MSISRLRRLGATLAVTALAAAGTFLIATPANAAGESITLANNEFAVGNWGDGITLTGEGFTPDTVITVGASVGNGSVGEGWGETTTTSDASGAIALTGWIPQNLPGEVPTGWTAQISAFDAADPEATPAFAELVIGPFVPLPAALTITPTCLTSESAQTEGEGLTVVGTGFLSAEQVLDSTTGPDGQQFGTTDTLTADLSGTVSLSYTLSISSGTLPAGTYTEYMVGQESGVSISATFTIGDCSAPAEVPAAAAAAPQLANTGSGDAGLLAGGAAALLLAGAVLVARRRAVAAK